MNVETQSYEYSRLLKTLPGQRRDQAGLKTATVEEGAWEEGWLFCASKVQNLFQLISFPTIWGVYDSSSDIHGLLDDGDPPHVSLLDLEVLELLHYTRLEIINT